MSTSDTLGKHVRYLQECNSTKFVVDVIVIVFTFVPIIVVTCNECTKRVFILALNDIKGGSYSWVGMLHGFMFLGDITIRVHMIFNIIRG